jgi:hypothetical protein
MSLHTEKSTILIRIQRPIATTVTARRGVSINRVVRVSRPVPNPLAGCLLKEAFLFHLLRPRVEWRVGPGGPTHVFLFFSRFLGWLASHAEPSAVFFVAVETPAAGIRLTSIQVGIGPKSRSTFVSEPSAVFGARIQGLGGRDRSRRLWFKANPFHYVNKSLG